MAPIKRLDTLNATKKIAALCKAVIEKFRKAKQKILPKMHFFATEGKFLTVNLIFFETVVCRWLLGKPNP
jgi:hypothetical protein